MTRRRRPYNPATQLTLAGGTRAWANMVKRVVREEPICWLRLPGVCTVRSTTADHVQLRSTHGHLTMTRSNLRGACRRCNQRRGDTPYWKIPALRARLAQQQKPARALAFFGGKR